VYVEFYLISAIPWNHRASSWPGSRGRARQIAGQLAPIHHRAIAGSARNAIFFARLEVNFSTKYRLCCFCRNMCRSYSNKLSSHWSLRHRVEGWRRPSPEVDHRTSECRPFSIRFLCLPERDIRTGTWVKKVFVSTLCKPNFWHQTSRVQTKPTVGKIVFFWFSWTCLNHQKLDETIQQVVM